MPSDRQDPRAAPLIERAFYELQAQAEAISEPLLRNRLISPDGSVTGINVTLQMPQKSLEVDQPMAALLGAPFFVELPDFAL